MVRCRMGKSVSVTIISSATCRVEDAASGSMPIHISIPGGRMSGMHRTDTGRPAEKR